MCTRDGVGVSSKINKAETPATQTPNATYCTNTMEEINGENARVLGNEMNLNYAATVSGMAKTFIHPGSKLTSAKAKSVTNKGCVLSVVTCRGDLCEMKSGFYEFHPPLKSAKDLEKRLVSIRNEVCAPKVHWLLTKPLAVLILISCGFLGYATVFLGREGMLETFARNPRLQAGIVRIFSSTTLFAHCVQVSWYFVVFAHLVEATIAANLCTTHLHLNLTKTFTWFVLILMAGYPIFTEFQALSNSQIKSTKAKN
jgi:hypothetical protein